MTATLSLVEKRGAPLVGAPAFLRSVVPPTEADPEKLILEALPDLARIAAHYFRDTHDREEMLQDIMVQLLDRFDSYRSEAPFGHWALAVASRMCISKLRRKKLVALFSTFKDGLPEPESAEGDPGERAEVEDHRRLLRDCLERLSAREREVLTLTDMMGMKDAEAATVIGITPVNLRVRRHRARANLKTLLEGMGYEHQ